LSCYFFIPNTSVNKYLHSNHEHCAIHIEKEELIPTYQFVMNPAAPDGAPPQRISD